MALAAALEDPANPEALYVVYMKLAEIHGNHMPDAQLCQEYRDKAQSLKGVLAGEEGAAVGEDVNAGPGQNMEERESLAQRNVTFTSPENEKCEDNLRTCIIHGDTEDRCTDTNIGDNHNMHLDADVDAFGFETETIASQDSNFTESFDTAKEQMSDSSSSTDTLQTHHNQTDGKDFDTDHSVLSHHHKSDNTDAQNTPTDKQNTPTKEIDTYADDEYNQSYTTESHC